ncbi:unknown [Prevotella sp. CAG:732]|nr:unknown [Prevotella sp. CAG:732]
MVKNILIVNFSNIVFDVKEKAHMLVVLRDVRLCFLVLVDNMIASVSECTCKAEFSFFYKFSKIFSYCYWTCLHIFADFKRSERFS